MTVTAIFKIIIELAWFTGFVQFTYWNHILIIKLLSFLPLWHSYRHEAELAAAASQPLPDDDDDAFE